MNFDMIPGELKQLPRWVLWKYERRNGKKTKVPYTVSGSRARADNPATWSDYGQAAGTFEASGAYHGIGFMLGDGWVGVDLDHCMEGQQLNPPAGEILGQLGGYAETSPSGSGLHIILHSSLGGGGRRGNIGGQAVEVYPAGRYFTMTGDVLPGYEHIMEDKGGIPALVAALDEAKQRKAKPGRRPQGEKPRPAAVLSVDIDSLLARARQSKQGAAFSALYDAGDLAAYQGDGSRADQALCNMLCFWLRADAAAIDEAFRRSALMRPKWDELHDPAGGRTYGRMTIDKAIKDCREVYDPAAFKQQKTDRAAAAMAADGDVIAGGVAFPSVTVDDKGNVRPVTVAPDNVAAVCDAVGIGFRYNKVLKEVEVTRPDLADKSAEAVLSAVRAICHKNGLKINRQDLSDAIQYLAESHSYSPVQDFLNDAAAKWDGKDHIGDWFSLLQVDPAASDAELSLYKKLFTKWLISAVVMAFNDKGTKHAEGVFILQGGQGIGKTRFGASLVPVPAWYGEGMTIDPANKDDVLKAARFWIGEVGEFGDTMRKERRDKLKQYFTNKFDVLRKPYGRKTEDVPRMHVFIGTVNDERFLLDATGDRRYWVVPISGVRGDAPDVGQLWGQVMDLAFKKKCSPWLNGDDLQQLLAANRRYSNRSTAENLILDAMDWEAPLNFWREATASDVCAEICLPASHCGKVGKALQAIALYMKGVEVPTRNGDARFYKIPPRRIRENDFHGLG